MRRARLEIGTLGHWSSPYREKRTDAESRDAMGEQFLARSDSRAMNSTMTRRLLYKLWIIQEMVTQSPNTFFCLNPNSTGNQNI